MQRIVPGFGVLLLASLMSAPASPARDQTSSAAPQSAAASAREKLAELYAIWGRARVEVDRPTLEELLASDFQLILGGKQSSRAEFLDMVTKPGGLKLLRFDVDILTMQRTGNTWTAVIAEKLEWERTGPAGETSRISDLWVTRDVCSDDGSGTWQFHSSEAIGNENWPPGVKPPVRTW